MNLEGQQRLLGAIASARAILTAKNTETPMRVPDKPWVRAHLLWTLDRAVDASADRYAEATRLFGFVQGCMACNGWARFEELEGMLPTKVAE